MRDQRGGGGGGGHLADAAQGQHHVLPVQAPACEGAPGKALGAGVLQQVLQAVLLFGQGADDGKGHEKISKNTPRWASDGGNLPGGGPRLSPHPSARIKTDACFRSSHNPSHPSPLTWAMRLRMTRPGFLLLTVAACLLGLAWASAGPTGGRSRALDGPGHGAAGRGGACGGPMCSTITTTRATVPMPPIGRGLFPFSGGSRLIQQGLVSVRTTGRWAAVLLWGLVPTGIGLALYSGSGVLGIGLIGLLLAWGYSAPPLALMSRGLGGAGRRCRLVAGGAGHLLRSAASGSWSPRSAPWALACWW